MQVEHCEFADDALYDFDNNVWIRLDADRLATLGITSVHAALAGKLNRVKFKAKGTTVYRGQSAATIESVKYFGAVRTPLSGTLVDINSVLETKPKLANDAPYAEGWFVKIEPNLLSEEIRLLENLRNAEERIRGQIRELRVRCFKVYPDYEMWEIGVECAAVLVRLNELMERMAISEAVHVVSDDPTADIEMERWSDQTGQPVVESRKEGRLVHFIVRKMK